MPAYVYHQHSRVLEAPTRKAAMDAARRLAGARARFIGDRCHGIVGHFAGPNGTFTITE